jgi:uncharacterized protein YgbK (DUF1537 family)
MLTILADDLTGACDTGSLFAGGGTVPVSVWPAPPIPGRVRVVDTETRAQAADEAGRRVAAVAAGAPAGRYFKKIDSALRGHVGPEVDALMRAIGAPGAVLAPAFPAQGRTIVDRILYVDGLPITETSLGRTPEFRGTSANVVEMLRPRLDRALAWIPLDQVRAGAGPLAARLERLRGTVALADAETDEDLIALVDAALALDPAPLLVGAAGLGRALAQRLGLLAERVELPVGGRWLIVAGSRHAATRAQIAAARSAGLRVLATAETAGPDRAQPAVRLAAEARRVLAREAFDVVAVTGGQTAVALYEALGAERLDLLGAPGPGLAFGYLRTPEHPALGLLTKAGSFGAPALFVSLHREAVA